MNAIKNAYVNTRQNKIRLAEIHFTNKIEKIVWKSDEIDWAEISSPDKKSAFVKKFANESGGNFLDAKFNLLAPGAIDAHVHFNTPGFEAREDFEHGTTAAAHGGVTTIIDMPCTSLPPVTNRKNMLEKLDAVKNRSLVDFAFRGGVRGNDFGDENSIERQVKELAEAGVVGFKVYVISGMETFTDLTYEQIEKTARIVKSVNKPLCVHAEDKELVISRRAQLQAENKNDWKAYCSARDVEAETVAVKRMIEIAAKTGVGMHIVHLSSAKALSEIINARKKGINITAETCPHYLYFTQKDFENPEISAFLKTAPPVKLEEDKLALWNGLANEEMVFVTTDHAGCNPETEKTDANFWKVYGGIPGVEHRVPFLFSEGFLKGKLTLEQTIGLLSTNVAKFYSLKNKGEIRENRDADFTLINLWESEIVSAENMHSKGKYTPFQNVKFNAIVETTFLRGKIVASRKFPPEETIGYGEFIVPQ